MKLLIFLCLVSFSLQTFAEERLRFLDTLTEIPATSKKTFSESFSRSSIPGWSIILGTTGLLYQYDEEIYADLQRKGRAWNIGNQDNTSAFVSISGHEIVRLPRDTGSTMYFLGDGWAHASIAGGFMGVGALRDNTHAYNTGIMIFHGMFVSTIFNQTLKRSFGRESPEVKTSERGSWNLFPAFNDYNNRTASYDAMPSGHVMTATMTFTILSERYPEYKQFLYPLGGVWISALMFQMVNNGVHWASDYPLGIGMGYLIGKLVTQMGGKKIENKENKTSWNEGWLIVPSLNPKVTALNFSKAF